VTLKAVTNFIENVGKEMKLFQSELELTFFR